MSILQDWYPGNLALEFFAIIALGAALLSTTAWVLSGCLARNPAARHLVLLSALLGCLAMPVLAAAFNSVGITVLSIPLLPARPSGPQEGLSPTLATRLPATGQPAAGPLATRTNGQAEPASLSRPGEGTNPVASPGSAVATLTTQSSAAVSLLSRPDRNAPLKEWPLAFRETATLLLTLWACGSALLLLRFGRSGLLVRRLRRALRPLTDPSLHGLLAEACRALGLKQAPGIFLSSQVATPLAVGFWRPVVILPDRLIGAVTHHELRDVLLHEVAHVRRHDPQVVLVQELVRALYWPIVPVHGLLAELSRAREELCDNHVLQNRDALSYGETLLHLAELSLEARPLASAVGILHWRGALERRIAGFLDNGRGTMTRTDRWVTGFVALTFLAGGMLTAGTRLITAAEKQREVAESPVLVENAPGARADDPPKRTMKVHVLGPDGQPMPGVRIHRSVWTRKLGARGNLDVVTDDQGQVLLEVPEGIYIWRLWARASGYVPLFADWEKAENPEQNLPAEFTFRLDRGTTIGGTVHDPDGKPIKGVAVEVMLQRGGEKEGRTGPDMWLAEGSAAARTDTEGRWTLDNVPPGLSLQLRLRIAHPDYISDSEWGGLQEQQGVGLKELRTRKAMITMRAGLVAAGTVIDPQGKPVTGAVVVRGDHPYMEWGSQEVLTDENGHYRLPPLASGSLNITVIAQGWMPTIRTVEIKSGMSPFDFRLEPGKELKIRFLDDAGKPVPGVGVIIDQWRGGESLYNHRHPNVIDTRIPDRADQDGRYVWSWAPGDAVTYRFFKDGIAEQKAKLTANGSEQSVSLHQVLRISGKVTDAATGRPILRGMVMAVIEQGSGRLFTERNNMRTFSDGTYSIQPDRAGDSCRVRIEADGYRSTISESVRAGTPNSTLDIRLEPAAPLQGRILDPEGKPVKHARVYLATGSQIVFNPEDDQGMFNQQVLTDPGGRFVFPAQCERYVLLAIHVSGYVEIAGEFDQQPGDLILRRWAKIQGTLLQAGKPVPGVWISFHPLRLLGGGRPHVQQDLSVQTDRDGRFVFPRVPPIKGSVQAQISVFQPSPLTSSQWVPLDLQPGQSAEVDLGGKGTVVKGRVRLSGDAASTIDLTKSLNWLLLRAPGIEPPPEIRSAGFTVADGWNNVWTTSQEGDVFRRTLHTHFVKLDKDGRFAIQGVPAGDYDLALRLYEPPGNGCLVNPVGSRIVRIEVSEEAARRPTFDLGEIAVKVAIGPRAGDPAPDFLLTPLLHGNAFTLSSLRGRYVLLDFWATWCAPCVAEFPALAKLHAMYKTNDRVMLLGVNLDDDPTTARTLLHRAQAPWTQDRPGTRPTDRDDVLTRYAISSVPCYILIGPDGKLSHRGWDLEETVKVLERLVR
jgi:beta-lactamase regulating signal transducer with metallopeptidase domain/thiol-disulfide isomerase/thioredoxin